MAREATPWWLATLLILAGVSVAVWLSVEMVWWGHTWALWVLLGAAGVDSLILLFVALRERPTDTRPS